MSLVLEKIENQNVDLNQTAHYAAIIGETPSKGAKSPVLWNAAFKKLGIDAIMHPLDVANNNLQSVVDNLREDEGFIGGAVTMPYKIDIIPFLDSLETEAEMIGAVNCIYREGKSLVGANTDGAGALWSLQQAYGDSLSGKKVLVLGTGGAGLAVASYIGTAIGQGGHLLLANRSKESSKTLAAKLQEHCQAEYIDEWPITADKVKDIDILVNCTSIGFETLKKDDSGYYSLKLYSPLGSVDNSIRISDEDEDQYREAAAEDIKQNNEQSKQILDEMDQPFVFDIIYQPLETTLLSLAKASGCNILNGLAMNLEQAVIAFQKATSSSELFQGQADEIREIMDSAR